MTLEFFSSFRGLAQDYCNHFGTMALNCCACFKVFVLSSYLLFINMALKCCTNFKAMALSYCVCLKDPQASLLCMFCCHSLELLCLFVDHTAKLDDLGQYCCIKVIKLKSGNCLGNHDTDSY